MTHQVDLEVVNARGIHLNCATKIVALANRFVSRVTLHGAEVSVDAKNVMDILQLTAACGARIRVEADGPDAAEAATAMARLFAGGFGEEMGAGQG